MAKQNEAKFVWPNVGQYYRVDGVTYEGNEFGYVVVSADPGDSIIELQGVRKGDDGSFSRVRTSMTCLDGDCIHWGHLEQRVESVEWVAEGVMEIPSSRWIGTFRF